MPTTISIKEKITLNLKLPFLIYTLTQNIGSLEMGYMIKKDAFLFFIVRMSYRDSNIPTRNFYAPVGYAILCLARITSSKEKFEKLIPLF